MAGGLFTKARFAIDLHDETVTCPAGITVGMRRGADGDGIAYFADGCTACPLRAQCTNAAGGRHVVVGRYELHLADVRAPASASVDARLPGDAPEGLQPTRSQPPTSLTYA